MNKQLVAKDKTQFTTMKELATLRPYIRDVYVVHYIKSVVKLFNKGGKLPILDFVYVEQIIRKAKESQKIFVEDGCSQVANKQQADILCELISLKQYIIDPYTLSDVEDTIKIFNLIGILDNSSINYVNEVINNCKQCMLSEGLSV